MSERRWGGSRADAPFRILYDGWPLAYQPSGPAALHLLALFAHLPAEVEGTVALPAPSPHILPGRLEQARRPAANTPAARLNWEQRTLSALANEAGAVLIHLVGANPPLSGSLPVVESPASVPVPRTRPLTISERLRESLSVGAAAGVSAALWPADLSHPGGPVPAIPLPPVVHPAFTTPAALRADLPPGYILYHGPLDERSLLEILEGWTWAGPAVGGEYPLLFAGLSEKEEHALRELASQADLSGVVQSFPATTVEDWAALYRQASEVVTIGPEVPWGSPALHALAAARPLVTIEEARTSERVGPAAYLVHPGDARELGAAMTTLVVETEMADTLAGEAGRRSAAWGSDQFSRQLLEAYRTVLEGERPG